METFVRDVLDATHTIITSDEFATFFDRTIFFLVFLVALLTVSVVWFESIYTRRKMNRDQWAIVIKETSLGSLFGTAFFLSYFPQFARYFDVKILWALRLFLLAGCVNYLYAMVRSFLTRYQISFRHFRPNIGIRR